MFDQILVGATTSLVNLVIHAILLAGVVRVVQGVEKLAGAAFPARHAGDRRRPDVLLVAAHFLEVLMWASLMPR